MFIFQTNKKKKQSKTTTQTPSTNQTLPIITQGSTTTRSRNPNKLAQNIKS